MPTHGEPTDLLPNTPTAQILKASMMDADVVAAGKKPKPTHREVPINPDSPDAPTCSGRRYIIADPDAPDAPLCKPKRYIIAPEPGSQARETHPDWARSLAEDLAERFK